MARTKTYRVWLAMMARCYNPRCNVYPDFGGRGIRVCSRWDRFTCFYEDMGEQPPGYLLGRLDVHGDYCPENCRWMPREEHGRLYRRRIHLPATS